jgi:hypothetical protein
MASSLHGRVGQPTPETLGGFARIGVKHNDTRRYCKPDISSSAEVGLGFYGPATPSVSGNRALEFPSALPTSVKWNLPGMSASAATMTVSAVGGTE